MFALILQPSPSRKKAGNTPTSDLLLVVSNCCGKSHTGFGAKFFKMRAKLHIPVLQVHQPCRNIEIYTLLNFLRSRSIYSITQPTKAQKRRHRSGSKQNLAPRGKLDVHLGSRPAWAPVFGSCRLSLSLSLSLSLAQGRQGSTQRVSALTLGLA